MREKVSAVVSALFISSICSLAQIANVTDDTIAPIAGSGHDYIKMLAETVNPANGSLNLQIQLPVAPGRQLTLPFSLAYNSNTVHHLVPSTDPHYGMAKWDSNKQYLSQGGWSYALPIVTGSEWEVTAGSWPNTYTCVVYSNYVFMDSNGGPHALGLGESSSGFGTCRGVGSRQSGDAQVIGLLQNTQTDNYNPTSYPPTPVTVTTHDGTVYNFSPPYGSGSPAFSVLPTSVEDRNGNVINVTDNQNGTFSVTDTAGRTAISSNGFGPAGTTNTITVSGLAYQVTWRNVSASFSVQSSRVGSTFDTCSPPPAVNDTQTAISQITFPNGLSYRFYYGDNPDPAYQNPYGLLSEIDYPSGGSVKYTWKLSDMLSELGVYPGAINSPPQPDPDGCLYQYQTPVVASRVVSTASSAVLNQTFTYSTTWGSDQTSWTQKTTNVNNKDYVFNSNVALTKYTYQPVYAPAVPFVYTSYPGQIAVESTIQYYDWGNTSSPLRTVNKGWASPFLLGCESDALETGLTSAVWYVYDSNSQVTHKKEYDYGVVGNGPCSPSSPPGATPTRETVTSYHSFSAPPNGGLIQDKPDSVQLYGAGTLAAETDYLYDEGTVGSGHSPTQHDGNYSTSLAGPRGNATTVTRKCLQSCADLVMHYGYDETGQTISSKDSANNTTQYSYADNPSGGNPYGNSNAYLTNITYAAANGIQQQLSFAYSYSAGELTTSTDQNGKQTGYIYSDSLRRITEVDYANTGKTTYDYHGDALPLTTTQTRLSTPDPSIVTSTVYDGLGRVWHTSIDSDPDGATTVDNVYDGFDRLFSQTNPHRTATYSTDGTTQYTYDGIGRVVKVTRPDNNIVTTSYSGNCTTVTDEALRARQSCADGLGRVTSLTEPNQATGSLSLGAYLTIYAYDALDNLASVNQQGDGSLPARNRSFNFNSLSHLVSTFNPESNWTYYTYDAATDCPTPNSSPGDLVKRVDGRGIRTCYQYDALHRLTNKNYSDSTPAVGYVYDLGSYNGLATSNGVGRRIGMSDGTGQTAWSYNEVGNLLTKRQTIAGVTNSIVHTYNLSGGVDTLTSPNGHVYTYTYGGAGRALSLADNANGITYAQSATYAPPGELSSATHGLNHVITESNNYNSRLQPTLIFINAPSEPVLKLSYNWVLPSGTNNGNIYQIQNTLDSTRSLQFDYDYLNRLSSGKTYNTSTWGDGYVYDAFGNLLQKNVTQGTAEYLQISVDANNHINGYTYDGGGNVLHDASNLNNWLLYDAENRMTPDSGGTIVYKYDGEDRRVSTLNGDGTTLFWYDENGELIATTGAWTRDYVYFNGRRLAYYSPSSGNQHYYWSDHLGSASVMSNSDGSSIEWASDYYPFGTRRPINSSLDNFFLFSDYQFDYELGYYYAGAREQSPVIGRFMSPDPIGIMKQKLADPQQWHMYSYARNNPLRFADPTGKYICSGSAQECKKFEDARKRDLNSKSDDVRNAAAKYGDPNTNNGVKVSFGEPGAGKNGTTRLGLEPDPNNPGHYRASADVKIRGNLSGTALQDTVAHEGSHVGDGQAFAATVTDQSYDLGKNITDIESEIRAYRISNIIWTNANQTVSVGRCGSGGCMIGPGVQGSELTNTIMQLLLNPANGYNHFEPNSQGEWVNPLGMRLYPEITTPR